MKKKTLIVTALAALCIATTSAGALTAASAEGYDGETNLATDSSLWAESWWTTNNGYATIDSNGIVFDEYGTSSAVAAVSLKEGLPYEGEISMTFNSEIPAEGDPAGFLKVIFADCSGAANGNAMKPWEISEKVEHLALEVKYNAVSLWRYNADNVYGTHEQQTLKAGTTNYIDGKDHTVTIEYSTSETAYDLKLSIDGTVQFDGSIATTKLYCNNILTIGGYANATVSDDLTVSSVKVAQKGEEPAPVIDEDNLLGKADAWKVAQDEKVTFDATTATLAISGYQGADAAILNEALPSEAKISLKAQLNVPTEALHKAVAKIVILSNETQEVVLQLDDDGNMWLLHTDYSKGTEGELVNSSGDWAPSLLTGANSINISVTPELTNGDEDIYVSVSAGSKLIGLVVNDLSLMNGNKLALLGGESGSVVYSSVKVEDLVKEKSASVLNEVDLLEDAASWSVISAPIEDGAMKLGGSGYAAYTKALPVNGSVEFAFTATDDSNAWYYLGFSNFVATLQESSFTEGQASFKITASGSQTGFFTMALNGTSVTTKSPALTDLCDGNKQVFKFVTETVAEGLKVTVYRNDVEEYSAVYASDTALGSSQGFYVAFRSTGAQTADPVISGVKSSYEETVDVTAYNTAIATKRAIYALNAAPTEENAAEVKAAATALLTTLESYTAEQLEVANNALYAEYVIAKADEQLAVAADKAAAKAVVDAIDALDYETITADNVEAAKAALDGVKTQYNALTDAQKAYVTNYAAVETLEIAINDYELSVAPGPDSSSSSETPEESASVAPGANDSETEASADEGSEDKSSDDKGSESGNGSLSSCFGSIAAVPALGIIAVACGAILRKKKED